MNNSKMMRGLQLAVGGTLLMIASLGHAQYAWVDAKGVKQFSDRPPPPSIPAKNVLKAPRLAAVVALDEATAAPAATVAAVKAAPKSVADREADYRKRQVDKAESDKKAEGEAEVARNKLAACTSARQSRAQLDSGVAMRDGSEERSWLTDKQRDERKAAANKIIDEHCM